MPRSRANRSPVNQDRLTTGACRSVYEHSKLEIVPHRSNSVRVTLVGPAQPGAATLYWRAFEEQGPSPRTLEVRLQSDLVPPQGVRGLVQASRCPAGWCVNGPDFSADISADRSRIRMVNGPDPFGITLVVRLLVSLDLLDADGLLCHGVGISHEGRGALFVGESGAGKSTLGELCRPRRPVPSLGRARGGAAHGRRRAMQSKARPGTSANREGQS